MTPQLSSRANAAKNKKDAVSNIEALLLQQGYEFTPGPNFLKAKSDKRALYSTKFDLGSTLYGTPRSVDFVLYHPTRYPDLLAIEIHWQQVSGTADEKLPYFALTIRHATKPVKTVMVLGGDGFRDCAKRWLIGQKDDRTLVEVLDLVELFLWAKGNL